MCFQPGNVHVSNATRKLLPPDRYKIESRGIVTVKVILDCQNMISITRFVDKLVIFVYRISRGKERWKHFGWAIKTERFQKRIERRGIVRENKKIIEWCWVCFLFKITCRKRKSINSNFFYQSTFYQRVNIISCTVMHDTTRMIEDRWTPWIFHTIHSRSQLHLLTSRNTISSVIGILCSLPAGKSLRKLICVILN